MEASYISQVLTAVTARGARVPEETRFCAQKALSAVRCSKSRFRLKPPAESSLFKGERSFHVVAMGQEAKRRQDIDSVENQARLTKGKKSDEFMTVDDLPPLQPYVFVEREKEKEEDPTDIFADENLKKFGPAVIGLVVSGSFLFSYTRIGQSQQPRYEDVLASYEKKLEDTPNDGEILRIVADTKLALERYDESLPLMEKLSALSPDDPTVCSVHALNLRRLNRDAEALQVYKEYLARHPFELIILQGAVRLLDDQKDYSAALQLASESVDAAESLVASDPTVAAKVAAQVKEAAKAVDRQTTKDQGVQEVFKAIAQMINTDKTADANVDPPREAAEVPDIMALKLVKGQSLVALKRYDDAIGLFGQLIQDYPSDWRGYLGKGNALELQSPKDPKKMAEAQVMYFQARYLAPPQFQSMFRVSDGKPEDSP